MSFGFVYFIREEETCRIKIGFSEKNPKGRLKDFQTGNSNKLDLIGYIEGKKEDENRIHQEFYEERIRSVNEWFEPSSCLKERIIELLEKALEEKKRGIEKLNLEFNKGEKKNGKENGPGILNNSNAVYEGEYKYEKKHGKGTLTYPDGTKKIGVWWENYFWKGKIHDENRGIIIKIVKGKEIKP